MGCEQDFDPADIPPGEPCYGGLDLSGTRDLTALALYFPRLRKAFVEFWTPRDSLLERAKNDRVPYEAWHRQGHIHAPKGMAKALRTKWGQNYAAALKEVSHG